MKKQLLIVAIAATMTSASMAAMDGITLTGNAKFEYNSDKKASVKSNTTNTEVNLNFRGKKGDTKVVLDLEMNTHGPSNEGNAIDVEDMYITTKLGMVDAKFGNYYGNEDDLLGAIESSARSTNKMEFSTTIRGIKVSVGNTGKKPTTAMTYPEMADAIVDVAKAKVKVAALNDNAAFVTALRGNAANHADFAAALRDNINYRSGDTPIDNSMFVSVSGEVAGWTLQAKKNNQHYNSFGVSGKAGPVGVRFETLQGKGIKSDDTNTKRGDAHFLNLTGEFSGVKVGYAVIKADAAGIIKQDDSSIFGVSPADGTTVDDEDVVKGISQIMLSTDVAGNTLTAKVGKLKGGASTIKDSKIHGQNQSFYYLNVERDLASGATLNVTYINLKNPADVGKTQTSNKTLEFDISVKF